MPNPLQHLLVGASPEATAFPPNSRYHGLAIRTSVGPDGTAHRHVTRRFVPPPERFELVQLHTVVQGDRLDNLAHTYHGDPEAFWLLCDANGAIRPDHLTNTIGRQLRITLPEGIPGGTGA
jgi:hypothetical protein